MILSESGRIRKIYIHIWKIISKYWCDLVHDCHRDCDLVHDCHRDCDPVHDRDRDCDRGCYYDLFLWPSPWLWPWLLLWPVSLTVTVTVTMAVTMTCFSDRDRDYYCDLESLALAVDLLIDASVVKLRKSCALWSCSPLCPGRCACVCWVVFGVGMCVVLSLANCVDK